MIYIISFFTLVLGFIIAWFISSKKQNSMRDAYEQAEKKLVAEKSEIEKQKSVVSETLRIRADSGEIGTKFDRM
jgi:Flp pilus assembly protein TadG